MQPIHPPPPNRLLPPIFQLEYRFTRFISRHQRACLCASVYVTRTGDYIKRTDLRPPPPHHRQPSSIFGSQVHRLAALLFCTYGIVSSHYTVSILLTEYSVSVRADVHCSLSCGLWTPANARTHARSPASAPLNVIV